MIHQQRVSFVQAKRERLGFKYCNKGTSLSTNNGIVVAIVVADNGCF